MDTHHYINLETVSCVETILRTFIDVFVLMMMMIDDDVRWWWWWW